MATNETNATRFSIEPGYPRRSVLPDELTAWDASLPDNIPYGEPVTNFHPDQGTVVEKLRRSGLDISTEQEVIDLSRMGFGDVATQYCLDFAEKLAELRYPLGRTGLNGLGIFDPGPNKTSDMIVAHVDDAGSVFVPLVFTRGRWNTPGGFAEPSDKSGLECGMREFLEETGHDLSADDAEPQHILTEAKPSDRTTDHGWIEADVFGVLATSRFDISQPLDKNEVDGTRWMKVSNLPALVHDRLLSKSKLRYIAAALRQLGIETSLEK